MIGEKAARGLRPFAPQRFGRYTLLAPLASGGMGEIYLARLEGADFEKLVVIKKILPALAQEQDFINRFVTEAKVLVKLQHGSVAQMLDMGEVEDERFIALEFVDGKDLRKVAARCKERGHTVPLGLTLFVMMRVLDALAYAHRKRGDDDKELGLVHRDVSPQNVLISYEGEVKVIDFGLAKSSLSTGRTNPSVILGKFFYMSPEQARHGKVDRRSDLYAAGICLYELVAGKNPFEGLSQGELMSAVANPRIEPLGQAMPGVPPSVEALVMKALATEPKDRFGSAEEMRGKVMAAMLEIDPAAGPESLAQFMRAVWANEFAQERRTFQVLREASAAERAETRPSPLARVESEEERARRTDLRESTQVAEVEPAQRAQGVLTPSTAETHVGPRPDTEPPEAGRPAVASTEAVALPSSREPQATRPATARELPARLSNIPTEFAIPQLEPASSAPLPPPVVDDDEAGPALQGEAVDPEPTGPLPLMGLWDSPPSEPENGADRADSGPPVADSLDGPTLTADAPPQDEHASTSDLTPVPEASASAESEGAEPFAGPGAGEPISEKTPVVSRPQSQSGARPQTPMAPPVLTRSTPGPTARATPAMARPAVPRVTSELPKVMVAAELSEESQAAEAPPSRPQTGSGRRPSKVSRLNVPAVRDGDTRRTPAPRRSSASVRTSLVLGVSIGAGLVILGVLVMVLWSIFGRG